MFEMKPWKKAGGKEIIGFRREMDHLFDRFFNMDFPWHGELFKEGRWKSAGGYY